jgi:alkyl hydroperoxide reductase subunit AhpC
MIQRMNTCATEIVATPVDWKRGDQCVILPSVSNDNATKLFPSGFTTV